MDPAVFYSLTELLILTSTTIFLVLNTSGYHVESPPVFCKASKAAVFCAYRFKHVVCKLRNEEPYLGGALNKLAQRDHNHRAHIFVVVVISPCCTMVND